MGKEEKRKNRRLLAVPAWADFATSPPLPAVFDATAASLLAYRQTPRLGPSGSGRLCGLLLPSPGPTPPTVKVVSPKTASAFCHVSEDLLFPPPSEVAFWTPTLPLLPNLHSVDVEDSSRLCGVPRTKQLLPNADFLKDGIAEPALGSSKLRSEPVSGECQMHSLPQIPESE
ncbi:unnamed protein product [Protopolystoma xenopodis]|uniref:Uncharacterized protein n=1 Tax=Protopolystoma xenopodis TaxID=117903 RepID=A0A3S5AEA0_9PLAT|nr:unnamed protein product [Protopolystoma xenopodis]